MQSPAHYRYYLDNPPAPSPSMRIGGYAHSLVLGGPRWYTVYDGVRRGKEWEFFEGSAKKNGLEVIGRTEANTAEAIAKAVTDHELAMSVLQGVREELILWNMQDRECQVTPDVVGPGYITELKVTNSDPRRLPWQAIKMGWLGQLAWYDNAINQAGTTQTIYPVSPKWREMNLVAVEPKPPHTVTVFSCTPNAQTSGHKLWRSLWETLMICEQSNNWPGYANIIMPLGPAFVVEWFNWLSG